jgi:hypothetical protein
LEKNFKGDLKMKKVKLEIEVEVQDTTKCVAIDKDGTIIESACSIVAPDDSIVWIASNTDLFNDDVQEIHTVVNWRNTLTKVQCDE